MKDEFITPKEFLDTYKEFANKYASHDNDCACHMTEVCDCGYSKMIKKLQKLEKDIKPKKT